MYKQRQMWGPLVVSMTLTVAGCWGGEDDSETLTDLSAAEPTTTQPTTATTPSTIPPTTPVDDEAPASVGPPTTASETGGSEAPTSGTDDAGSGTEAGGEPLEAGNGGGGVPADAQAVDTSNPSRVIGNGTPASCTSAEVVEAVAAGGIVTFDCGPDPVTITMTETAKVVNANGPEIVLDGGGLVTLGGGGERRVLYMNTCDEAQGWTTSHCQNQDHPRLTVQNLTFADGNSTGDRTEGGGGGAIFVRGGRFKVVNSRFTGNRCDGTGPDLGGAAIRVLSQYEGLPVYVTGSTFTGGSCSNGGALSSIGVSWVITDSVLTGNEATGSGANPARGGTPGGGSGGAVYTDGDRFTVEITSSRIEDNHANEGGGAVFFVSNDRTGTMSITDSTLRDNPSDGFETRGLPGIFFLGATDPTITNSTLE